MVSLPFHRSRLSGHGQGSDVVGVPRLYAELALHLAAAVNSFLIHKSGGNHDPEALEGKVSSENPAVDDGVS